MIDILVAIACLIHLGWKHVIELIVLVFGEHIEMYWFDWLEIEEEFLTEIPTYFD